MVGGRVPRTRRLVPRSGSRRRRRPAFTLTSRIRWPNGIAPCGSCFWPLVLVATCVQLFFVFFVSSQAVPKQSVVLSALNEEAALTTRNSSCRSRFARYVVSTAPTSITTGRTSTTLSSPKHPARRTKGRRDPAYYSGSEGGESGVKAAATTPSPSATCRPIAHYLNVEYELGGDPQPQSACRRYDRSHPQPVPWSNYVVILFLLASRSSRAGWRNAFEASAGTSDLMAVILKTRTNEMDQG